MVSCYVGQLLSLDWRCLLHVAYFHTAAGTRLFLVLRVFVCERGGKPVCVCVHAWAVCACLKIGTLQSSHLPRYLGDSAARRGCRFRETLSGEALPSQRSLSVSFSYLLPTLSTPVICQ